MGEMGYMVVRQTSFWGRSHLVSVTYLIFTDASKMILSAPTNHGHVNADVNMISSGHISQGKYEEAEPLYRRALAIRKRVLGPEHPYIGIVRASYWTLFRRRDG